jgi:predicted NACHT family NTPase
MDKITSISGEIIFICRCGKSIKGNDDDTLFAEGSIENTESNLKHEVFIENSSYDSAKNIVLKDCLSCGLNYLTKIRIGINETTIYTCICGFRSTHEEYKKKKK